MTFWLVVAALVLGYVGRLALARRARRAFCTGGCVTLALRLKPGSRGVGWKHGYARLGETRIEWRGEYKLRPGADLTFDVDALLVTEHRPVVKGETMLSDLCELVFATYCGERVDFGVPKAELATFLAWTGAR